ERRHPQRVNRHRGIEPDPPHVYKKEGLNGAACQRPQLESVPPLAASRFLRTKQSKLTGIASDDAQPFLQSLHRFRVQRRPPFLPAFSPDLQNLVSARLLVIHHAKPC